MTANALCSFLFPSDPGGRRTHGLVIGGLERRLGEGRKRHGEGRTMSNCGADLDATEALIDQLVDDRHAESGARFAGNTGR